MLLVCEHLNSRANLSSIVRLAGCFGLQEVFVSGQTAVDPEIARDAVGTVTVTRKRTLAPFVEELRRDGYRIVALEQATGSTNLTRYTFVARTALVIGNERRGL